MQVKINLERTFCIACKGITVFIYTEQDSVTLRFTNCKSTVESFTGKLAKHTRKPCQARNEMAKGKGLQKIQWNNMAKAEKVNIIPVRTTSNGTAPHIVNLSTTW
jgi:hypothetical protein